MKAKHLTGLKIKLFLALTAASFAVSGQNLEVPKKEFAISFSKDQLELSKGEKADLDIVILKSKGYQKAKAKMGVSSSLSKGVTVTFSPDQGTFDETLASVTIQDDATPGQYMLVLNATLNSKTKGSILKLLIN